MKQETLKFRYTFKPVRNTEAWFLHGNSPVDWLAKICQWEVPLLSLHLLLIPQSTTNREPCGLLVTSKEVPLKQATTNGIPYGQAASRLFLPVEATIYPEVAEAELQALLSEQYTYVWHPMCGLVAFEPQEEKTIADFLNGETNQSTNWDYAIPGIAVSSQLRSISLIQLPDLSSLFESEEKEIGSEPDSLGKLPKDPIESVFGNIPNLIKLPAALFAKGILSLTKHAPTKTDGDSTWINHFENWAKSKLASVFYPDEAKRNKELNRLLNLLGNNPDEGLRYALPMGGDGGYRGIAPPTDLLVKRDLNVDFSRMGNGGPVDFWDIPYELEVQLLERYRELANRELQLGRYRRAAYIYAHLLGDYGSAAQTLKTGRQWREAAVLYKEKLNQPEEAAKCLIEGGLWAEAIAHYEELNEYEKIGDLHLKLNQSDEATIAYRQAVDHFQQQNSHIEASRILEEKLNSTDEAIRELESGWPHFSQARKCLENLFALYTKHGFHQNAKQKIDELSEMNLTISNKLPLVQFLTSTTTSYPDRSVCEHAEENARVLVSQSLDAADEGQKRELLSNLWKLVPADKLLQRDTSRYLQQRKKQQNLPKSKSQESSIKLLRTIQLSREVNWQTAVCLGESIFAAGYELNNDSSLVIERCLWNGTVDEQNIKYPFYNAATYEYPILLLPSFSKLGYRLFVQSIDISSDANLKDQFFIDDDDFPERVTVGDFKIKSSEILGATSGTSDNITWTLTLKNKQLIVNVINQQDYLISSHTIPIPDRPGNSDSEFQLPIPCLERRNKLYFAWGSQLGILDSQGVRFEEFHRPIKAMVASTPKTQIRIALSFDRGGTVIWPEYGMDRSEAFAIEMENPIACFNRNGKLIVGGSGTLEIYKTQHQKLEMTKDRALISSDPIAVLASNDKQKVGLLTQSGNIFVFQIE